MPQAPLPDPYSLLWKAENELYTEWLAQEPTLLRDGALGGPGSTYPKQQVRILFVLKEPNDEGGRWTARGADLRTETRALADLRSTFPVLLLLAYLAQQAATDPTLSLPFQAARDDLRNADLRLRLLESVALVNLKKTPGGPVCNDRSLTVAVNATQQLLLRQLSLYQPHLTIAGGSAVHALLAALTGTAAAPASPGSRRPWFTHPLLGLCLSFFHPQATKGFEFLYSLLRENLLAHNFHAIVTEPRKH